ncbi:MAG: TetR/AcrR family transcriptional regulator [Clostridia bacterium]|nr:TetR/AcrR family transcriptional regulator [Clostridia bacterium]
MPSVAENKQNKRLRILDSAFELFMQRSVNSTAIDDVVKAAGVAKGTFYLYFKDKYDLLNQLIVNKSMGLLRQAYKEAFADPDADFQAQMLAFVNSVIDALDRNQPFAALLEKNFSRCFQYILNSEDPAVRASVDVLLRRMEADGFDRARALQTLYLITDLTGSVCFDAIVVQKPFALPEIRPALNAAIAAILKEGGGAHDQ